MCCNFCYICNMEELNLFENILKKSGHSLTATRRNIFNEISRNHSISILDLTHKLNSIDRSTIYRTIDLFMKLNIINKVQIGWKYKIELSELFTNHHHHIVCSLCGKVSSFIEGRQLFDIISIIANEQDYALVSHQLSIIGLCSDCQKNDPRLLSGISRKSLTS